MTFSQTPALEAWVMELADLPRPIPVVNFRPRNLKPWPVDSENYHSKSVFVYDLSSQQIIFSKNPDQLLPIASLTKIMTALVALEKLDNYASQTTVVSQQAIERSVKENLVMAGFTAGEAVSFQDLLYGAMLPSGGEAATALAEAVSGSQEDFAKLMTQKARQLHMIGARFVNADGVDHSEQRVSSRGVFLLTRRALENPTFRQIFTSASYQTESGKLLKHSILASLPPEDQPDFKILGGKSGTTYEAGLCWAVVAEKNGREYIIVVLGAPLDNLNRPTPYQKQDVLNILQTIDNY